MRPVRNAPGQVHPRHRRRSEVGRIRNVQGGGSRSLVVNDRQHPTVVLGGIGFAAMIEHPRAMAHLHDIAERGPRLIAMMLGGEDFALETGSVPGDETLELPKRLVAFAAQAHDVAMIGILGTVADYSDAAAYKKSAERARRFGFSGGTCVHPGLVTALNEAFAPSADEVAQARRLIQADAEAAAFFPVAQEGKNAPLADIKHVSDEVTAPRSSTPKPAATKRVRRSVNPASSTDAHPARTPTLHRAISTTAMSESCRLYAVLLTVK